MMPRKKTDQVIEHRITLGTYERDLLDRTVGAYQVNKVGDPLVKLLSDNSAMFFVITALLWFLPREWLPAGWDTATQSLSTLDEFKDWLEIQNLAGYVAGGAAGATIGAAGGPIGVLIGAILGVLGGGVVVEVGEDVVAAVQDNPPESPTFIAGLILIRNQLGAATGLLD